MERTIYFSKVSLDSSNVYDLIENYELRFEITRNILSMIKHGFKFEEEYPYFTEDGEKKVSKISYVLSIKEKTDEGIHGILDRKAAVFVKERDEKSGEMKGHAVDNTEDIEFYYDVLHEYVAFISRRHFKKNMFNDAFTNILNLSAKKIGLDYSFYVETFNLGMTIEEIQNVIKLDTDIKELIITCRPANPDQAIIDTVQEAQSIELLKESNATEKSIIYKAKGKNTLNGAATVIQDDLKNLVEMNKDIPMTDLTQRGYIIVKSINHKGDVKTTADERPFVKITKDMYDFVRTAKNGITEILRKASGSDR